MNNLVWFRRDLRVTDNAALFSAANQTDGFVVGVFVITAKQWHQHNDADCKIDFWLQNIRLLSNSLGQLRIPLLIQQCAAFADVPQQLLDVAQKHNCGRLFFNREYEVNERERDSAVVAKCEAAGISVHRFHDRVIVPPASISTQTGKFYSVFTPYRKVWISKALDALDPLPKPKKQSSTGIQPSTVPQKIAGFRLAQTRDDAWPAGEPEAHKRLEKFCGRMTGYRDARDMPALKGTSLLSPYLTAGVISASQCLAAAVAINGGKVVGRNEGANTWITELAWRDFSTHVLVGFPRVSMNKPFRLKTESLPWRNCQQDFDAWKNGQTGYPIVDAGMQQLNQTGWMHNRLRMVTAMFLTKHLLIDWRQGESYFMNQLIDGDLAANNGGWQWSASTGTDAVPYFRIFNPFSQSKRFDNEGVFIKKYCPELESVPTQSLHDAEKLSAAIDNLRLNYPKFIVDHKVARERALNAFKSNG